VSLPEKSTISTGTQVPTTPLKKHTKRWLLITIGLLVLLVVGILAGASSWVRGFLRSEQFRTLVATKTGETLKSEVTISPLQWSGSSVYADQIRGTARQGGPLSQFQADQVRAEINWRSVFDGAWRVEAVDVLRLDAEIQTGGVQVAPAQSETAPVQKSGLLPQRFELGGLVASHSNIRLMGGQSLILSLNSTRLSIKPDGQAWAIEGSGGQLQIAGIPELGVSSFRSRVQGSAFFLTDGRLTIGGSGKITATGEFAETSSLRVEWAGVDIRPWLADQWKDRLTGLAAGNAATTWGANGIGQATTTGEIFLTEGRLEHVPVLEQIAAFTGSPQFKRMPVQQLSAKFSHKQGTWTLTSIVMESKGLMRTEGLCTIHPDGTIEGTFRVGVTPQTLQWIPGSRERVFTTAANGYVWTDVRIGGTVSNVTEDLSARIANAMKDEAIGVAKDALKNAPDTIQKSASDVLDVLTPLLR
jgi:hypothetical protein